MHDLTPVWQVTKARRHGQGARHGALPAQASDPQRATTALASLAPAGWHAGPLGWPSASA